LGERVNTLTQKLGWYRSQTVEISGEDLVGALRAKGNVYNLRFPLKDLDENTMEATLRPRGWGIAAGVLLLAGLLIAGVALVDIMRASEWELAGIQLIVSSVFLVPGVICLSLFWWGVEHTVFILSRYDGTLVLSLRADRPSRKDVAVFLDALLAEARRFTREIDEGVVGPVDGLATASEIRKFHDLCRQGIMTPDEFQRTKTALLRDFARE